VAEEDRSWEVFREGGLSDESRGVVGLIWITGTSTMFATAVKLKMIRYCVTIARLDRPERHVPGGESWTVDTGHGCGVMCGAAGWCCNARHTRGQFAVGAHSTPADSNGKRKTQ